MTNCCKKYTTDEVLLDEESNCSLCGSQVNRYSECTYAQPVTTKLRDLDSGEIKVVTDVQGAALVNEQNCSDDWQPYNSSDWKDGLLGLYEIVA